MKSDIEKILCSSLGKKLRNLETKRSNIINKRSSLWPWSVFFACLSVLFFFCQVQRASSGYIFVCALLPLLMVGTVSRMKRCLARDFKRDTIPILLSIMSPWHVWSPKKSISIEEFGDSMLYRTPDRYSGSDYVEGVHGFTHFRFSYVHSEEKHTVHELDIHGHSRMRTEYYTIFSGIFFSAHCDHSFRGRTMVIPSSHFPERILGKETIVSPSDPAFNKWFKVISLDSGETKHLLTPEMMDRLLALRKSFGEYRLSFSDNRVRIAIPGHRTPLDPELNRPFDREQVIDIYSRLTGIIGIIDDLNLNNRIRKNGPLPQSGNGPSPNPRRNTWAAPAAASSGMGDANKHLMVC